MSAPATDRPVDVHALPAMFTALRLPSFLRHWQKLAERADAEGWPAARLLAALADIELAERDTRRVQRHLNQSGLPGGKPLATFDFKAIPSMPRARIEALAAGDWIETGTNLIAIGNSGAGKTHLLCAEGHALVEVGKRVLYTRTTDLVQKLQAASDNGCCMMAATPAKLGSEADAGRSKAQHAVILAVCSQIESITYSASPNTALGTRLGAKTGLNDGVFVNNLTRHVPNGKCRLISFSFYDGCWKIC